MIDPVEIVQHFARHGGYGRHILRFCYPGVIVFREEDHLNENEVVIQPTAQQLRDLSVWCREQADIMEEADA